MHTLRPGMLLQCHPQRYPVASQHPLAAVWWSPPTSRSAPLMYVNISILCCCAAGPVDFRSSNGTAACDARYVQLLAMQTGAADGGSKAGSKGKGKHAPGRTQRSELLDVSLAEDDVAKVRQPWSTVLTLLASPTSWQHASIWFPMASGGSDCFKGSVGQMPRSGFVLRSPSVALGNAEKPPLHRYQHAAWM